MKVVRSRRSRKGTSTVDIMDNSQEDDILTSFIDSLDQKGSSESIFDQSASILKEPERYRSDEGTAQGETLSLQGMVVFKEMTRSADLCLRFSEETRCENAMFKASMKLATGSIFTVRIDLNDSGGLLGIGVKELQLKRLLRMQFQFLILIMMQ